MVYEPPQDVVDNATWLLKALSVRLDDLGSPPDDLGADLEVAADAVLDWCLLVWAEDDGRFEDVDVSARDAAGAWLALCIVRFELAVQALRIEVEVALEHEALVRWEADVEGVSRLFGRRTGDWRFALDWLRERTADLLDRRRGPW